MRYNSTIEEDGQSCVQEAYDKFGPDITSAVEKYLYTRKRRDGQTDKGPQILDRDITYWTLIDDDSYLEDPCLEDNTFLTLIGDEFL